MTIPIIDLTISWVNLEGLIDFSSTSSCSSQNMASLFLLRTGGRTNFVSTSIYDFLCLILLISLKMLLKCLNTIVNLQNNNYHTLQKTIFNFTLLFQCKWCTNPISWSDHAQTDLSFLMFQFIAGSQNLSSFCHSATRIDIARKSHLVVTWWRCLRANSAQNPILPLSYITLLLPFCLQISGFLDYLNLV